MKFYDFFYLMRPSKEPAENGFINFIFQVILPRGLTYLTGTRTHYNLLAFSNMLLYLQLGLAVLEVLGSELLKALPTKWLFKTLFFG